LALQIGSEYRNSDVKGFNGDDIATSFKNWWTSVQ